LQNATESANPEKLSMRQKLVYGFGDTGFSLTSTIVAAYFAIFLTDVVGVDHCCAAIFIGRTWDYINDPFIGHILTTAHAGAGGGHSCCLAHCRLRWCSR
jgi:GPH family glycoside/pentoside/hexuronide:cation symporter